MLRAAHCKPRQSKEGGRGGSCTGRERQGLSAGELGPTKPQVRLVALEQGAEHPAELSPLGLSILGGVSGRTRGALCEFT